MDKINSNGAVGAPLVSTTWLAERLGRPGVAVVDASWYLPAMQRDGRAEYSSAHIPGAVFFDIDAISDQSTDLPHMLPSEADFAAAMGALGISDEMEIVVYDGAGLFSAPRVWWMLTSFGAGNVHVLDGGRPAWLAEGHPTESGATRPTPTTFHARLQPSAVASFEEVRMALEARSAQVADARPAARFRGEAPEPRAGVVSGHMPGASNLPASDLIADGRLKAPEVLMAEFAKAGIDPHAPLITSCGSGVSAAILNLALATAGKPRPRLYDGSWTDWAARNAPVAPA
ncbi:MAG: 3-mercaptopyruvate sulfurtransferase [Beijerinckiaceae bacterium]|nr:3-mercaptopyruvate sulfurtransferase [Beijerinckiaceae bacterium]